ncbi:glycerol-3-phosphate dehydrogenase, partial [Methylobacterium radiotolerans]
MGAGSWGTTFAKVLGDAAEQHGSRRSIRLWGRSPEVVADVA